MAGTRFKAEYGVLATDPTSNSLFEHQVRVNANLTVQADLLYVGGNLYIAGDQVLIGQTVYESNLVPTAAGLSIGNNTNRFDSAYFNNVYIATNATPSSNGVYLGYNSARWEAFTRNINASGNLDVSGVTTVTSNLYAGNTAVTGVFSVTGASTLKVVGSGNTTVTGFVNVSSSANVGGNLNIVGTSAFTGNVVVAANVTSKGLIMDNAAFYTNTATVTTTTATRVDSFPRASGLFAKALITVYNATGPSVHMIETLIAHENTNAFITRYGEVYNTSLGSFDAIINGANVDIMFTAASAGTYTVKTLRQQILA